jgi:hypothetical protein
MLRSAFLAILIFVSSIYGRSWQRIYGSYSTVEFQEGNESIADSLLKISESSLIRLSHLFKISPIDLKDDPVRIILVDALDVSNGFALDNTVVIYTLSSAYISNWTGTQKWYEQVLNHELVHIFTFRKIKRSANLFGTFVYLTTPRWFYEGVAQYYAEDWNAYRGDIYIKNALFNGNLTLDALNNLEDGRLLYASGNAFVRYLVDQYGDSSLVNLMAYDSSAFFYNFSEGFKKVYGEPLNKIFRRFLRHMIIYYGTQYSVYDELEDFTRIPKLGSNMYQVIPLNSADSTFILSTQFDPFDQYRTAIIARMKKDRMEVIEKLFDNFHTPLVLSEDQNLIAYGRFRLKTEDNINGLSFDWFVYNRAEKRTIRLVSDKHIRFATFLNEKKLVLNEVLADGSVFHAYDVSSLRHETIAHTSMPVGRLVSLRKDHILFEAQRKNGHRDLFYLSSDTLYGLLNDVADDRLPVVVNENLFIFTRIIEHRPVLCLFDLKDKSFRVLLEDLNDYWSHAYIKKEKKLLVAQRGSFFSTISLDSLIELSSSSEKKSTPERYQSWISKKSNPSLLSPVDTMILKTGKKHIKTPYFPLEHALSMAVPVYDNEYGFGLYGLSTWFEILQRQALATTFVFFPGQINRSLIFLSHILKIRNFDLTSVYYHGPVIFSYRNNTHLDIVRDIGAFNISRQIALNGNPRWWFQPALGLIWNHYQLQEGSENFHVDNNYKTIRIGSGIQYIRQTRLFPLLPKRQIGLYAFIHQSLDKQEDFRIWESGFFGGTNIFFEKLGVRSHFSYLHQSGNQSRPFRVGIDRFFETNLPRDYGYTRAVRGVREDIYGDKLLWTSTELLLYIAQKTNLKLLFIPLNNLAISGFFDYAEISSGNRSAHVSGFGGEITSGNNYFRFGFGYAHGRKSNSTSDALLYWRISLGFPQPILQNP